MKNKTQAIKNIKAMINAGYILKVYIKNNKCKNINLWQNNKYIMWRSYGQSAIKNNLKDLTWLLNNILESKRQEIDFKIINSIIE